MVNGSTGFCRDDAVAAQPAEFEFIGEHVNHLHRTGVYAEIIQALWQYRGFASTLPLDVKLHGPPPL